MKAGAALAVLLGAGAAAYLFVASGPASVLGLLRHAGFGAAVVIAWHFLQILFDSLAWQALLKPAPARLPLRRLIAVRWIREGINNLLPVAQIGGEVVGARLLARFGVAMPQAAASAAVDLTLEMLAQVAFTLLGVLLLVNFGPGTAAARHAATYALVALAVIGLGFVAAQWAGLFKFVERALLHLGRQFGWRSLAETAGLHRAIVAIWRDPRGVLSCGGGHLASWLLGGVEVMLACHYLGHGVSLHQAIVLESLSQAMKSMAFAVPGGLGVQEGGLMLLAPLCGLSASQAMALALLKRLREIVLGLPALVAWHRIRRRAAIPAAMGAVPKWR